MKIAVVGKGNVGGGLADRWERAGHEVTRIGKEGGDVSDADAVLVAVPGAAVPDAVGDMRPHNLPGTSGDTYPNWRLPLADSSGRPVLLDELAGHPRVRSLARVLRALA